MLFPLLAVRNVATVVCMCDSGTGWLAVRSRSRLYVSRWFALRVA